MTNETETQAKAGAMIVPVTLFEQNCTIIWDEPSKKAVVIDPGGDVDKIQAAIKQTGVTVEKIWLTHGHIDHVGGAAELRDELKVPIEGPHKADAFLLANVVSSGARFGMTGGTEREVEMDGNLERAVLVYTTFPSIGEAEQVGQALLERRLCACVNILPGMVSLYWWHGGIDRGDAV